MLALLLLITCESTCTHAHSFTLPHSLRFLLNAGCIFNTAFVGTTISTFVIGLMQWAFGLAGIAYKMSLLHNLVFGALLSATGVN